MAAVGQMDGEKMIVSRIIIHSHSFGVTVHVWIFHKLSYCKCSMLSSPREECYVDPRPTRSRKEIIQNPINIG